MANFSHVYLSRNAYASNTQGDCEVHSEKDVHDYLIQYGTHGEYVYVRCYSGENRDLHEIPHEFTFRAWYNGNCRDPGGGVSWSLSQKDNAHRLWEKICKDMYRKDFGNTDEDIRHRLIMLGYNASFVHSLSDAQVARAGEIDDAADIEDYLNPDGRMA